MIFYISMFDLSGNNLGEKRRGRNASVCPLIFSLCIWKATFITFKIPRRILCSAFGRLCPVTALPSGSQLKDVDLCGSRARFHICYFIERAGSLGFLVLWPLARLSRRFIFFFSSPSLVLIGVVRFLDWVWGNSHFTAPNPSRQLQNVFKCSPYFFDAPVFWVPFVVVNFFC